MTPHRLSLWAPSAALAAALAVGVPAVQDAGGRGAASVAIGAVVVVGFFAAGALPLLVVRGQEQSAAALGAGILLLTYTLRLAGAVLVLSAVARADAVDVRWTGRAVVACALAWLAGQTVSVLRRTRAPAQAWPAEHDQPGHGHSGSGR